jgi:glycosyltransferase involved in cell wall biosynthesis
LARHLRSFDVVHAHNYHDLAALAAGFTHRQPFIFTPHYHGIGHTDFARRLHLVYRPLGQALFSRADQVICVSNAERLLVMDDYPAVASKTVVVSNGVTKRTTVPRSWADRDNLVVYAGRLEPYKRLDVVIAAMAELPADVRLLIIGTGSDKARLASSVIRLKLTDRITLAGALPDDAVASALAEARVVVTASQHEAFGLIILEARQAGARVVASALAAHREVAQLDPANGVSIWAPDTAVSGLAHAIRNALISHDPGAMSTAPRWSDVAAATEQVYQCALATPSMKSLSIAAQLGVG